MSDSEVARGPSHCIPSSQSASRTLQSALPSAWRPGHLAFGEKVDVKVRNGFAGMRAVVDHQPEPVLEVELLCELACGHEEVPEHLGVCSRSLADARNHLLRNDQQMDGCLGLDVMQDDAALILVFDLRGDLPVDDFLKDRFGHTRGPRNT